VGEQSKIEWTDHTFNPWVGCTKVSPGCDHCYAEGWAKRSGLVSWGADRRRTSAENWAKPLRWERMGARAGVRKRVFCASLADVFDNQVPDHWRDDLWLLIANTPHLDWLLLTKRIGNVKGMLPPDWGAGWPNVWLGASVVNQHEADRDIVKLLCTPARIHFLSCEPLLGSIDLKRLVMGKFEASNLSVSGFGPIKEVNLTLNALKGAPSIKIPAIDWVIAGGESGHHAREMEWDWPRKLRAQCAEAGVAFFMKQLSEASRSWFKDFEAFPDDLQVRQWPLPRCACGCGTPPPDEVCTNCYRFHPRKDSK
jgi:protein gp37